MRTTVNLDDPGVKRTRRRRGPSFADDLERVEAADRPPRNPWAWLL
jgi:hypothetical protein